MSEPAASKPSVEQMYPSVARWVQQHGWIEVGYDDMSRSFIRALDLGGLIWEGDATYATLDEALQAADEAIEKLIREQFGR